MDDYDVIIVGSGAGGGTLAAALAPTGRRILLVERGGYLPREPENWMPSEVFGNDRYVSPDLWRDGQGHEFQPQSHYFVGGATKMYGAALLRLHAKDFAEWPVSWQNFSGWYPEAEHMYRVGYVPHEPFIGELAARLRGSGFLAADAPSGVLVTDGPCQLCSTCDGFPCHVGGKADAETIAVRPTLARYGNVRLKTGARVTRLITAPGNSRRVEGVEVVHGEEQAGDGFGVTATYTAKTVVLSAGAVNSAALLLASGLANSSDQVGRNYMCHQSRAAMMITARVNPTSFQKTLLLDEWYEEGGLIQMLGRTTPEMYRGTHQKLTTLMPGKSLAAISRHAIEFWLMTEDRPNGANRVTVDRQGRITLDYNAGRTARNKMRFLQAQLKRAMATAGYRGFWATQDMPLSAVAHQAGTCRMGDNPATSVLNSNCRAWDLDNLYVVDASFMPTVGAVNPALTIIANALRVGAHLRGHVL